MLLAHARTMAHSAIYRTSSPDVEYPRQAEVPNADADDWEPVPKIQEPPTEPVADCGCGGPMNGATDATE